MSSMHRTIAGDVLVQHLRSDVMSIDQTTGKLTATDSTITVGKPVCVIFAK